MIWTFPLKEMVQAIFMLNFQVLRSPSFGKDPRHPGGVIIFNWSLPGSWTKIRGGSGCPRVLKFTSIKWSDGHPLVKKKLVGAPTFCSDHEKKQLGTKQEKRLVYRNLDKNTINYVDKLSNKKNVKWILWDGYVELNLRSTFSISNRNLRRSSKSPLVMKDFFDVVILLFSLPSIRITWLMPFSSETLKRFNLGAKSVTKPWIRFRTLP